ncbi:MAG: bifunctional demethylmenaquinone methyltransferase/2-methoxy-6-polyprenyl-1,4-benzoquinol methylase UbiE [Pelagibacterales bacterium MED-G40]|nr:MAG: bifunctional demethylmenaquinone methyltransferase/2-methoxy-6-polyprenyl-1,4-benzoquinol methylase UbiE [Pelagibacterales bacterium MED-G40]|tara:strand:+ start:53 stop:757 length:705 start_codon:yes stop_codon:yes gene_type:complete
MKNNIQDKSKLVNSVFSEVYKKYDIMNDIMSFGVHRIWKQNMMDWMSPQANSFLIDVASGTGDIALTYSKKLSHKCKISCVEPNKEMLAMGQKKLEIYDNIKWHKANAERLPFKDDTFDFYTISFGIRNVNNINLTLKEAFRVLKTGGRFMCLEFSKVENPLIDMLYKNYSKIIPIIGEKIVGSKRPYNYLVKSIDDFYNQSELVSLIKKNGFQTVKFRNLSNGIAAIHSGWKI